MVHIARTNVVNVLQLTFVCTQMVDARVIVATDSGGRNVLNVSEVSSESLFSVYFMQKQKTIGHLSFRF